MAEDPTPRPMRVFARREALALLGTAGITAVAAACSGDSGSNAGGTGGRRGSSSSATTSSATTSPPGAAGTTSPNAIKVSAGGAAVHTGQLLFDDSTQPSLSEPSLSE